MAKFFITRKPLNDEFYIEPSSIKVFSFAVFYLSIPAFLFLFGFVKPVFAYPIAVLLAVSLWFSTWHIYAKNQISLYVAAIIPALALVWLVGFPSGPFVWDWIKHWALINTLAENSWPIAIPLKEGVASLRFYIAAYLVPAGLHKLSTSLPIWLLTACWFGIGYLLIFRFVGIPFSKKGKLAVFLAMCALLIFAGADFFVENFFRLIHHYQINDWFGLHYEMWFANEFGWQAQYSSMLVALLWVPHQGIATFLVAGMIALNRGEQFLPKTLLAFGLLSLWSPYGMIGLLPLTLVLLIQYRNRCFNPYVILTASAGGAFALLIAFYLATDMPKNGMCISCGFSIDYLHYTAGFLLVELITFGLILQKKLFTDRICFIALLTLLLIPRFGGEAADFVMRASMGPLFILSLRSIEVLSTWRLQVIRTRLVWAFALLLCLPTAMSEVVYQITDGSAHSRLDHKDPLTQGWFKTFAQSPQINVNEFFDICGWHYLPQYFTYQTPAGIKSRD